MLLKYFRNIASGDLNALFPNARVVMSKTDKLFLGIPALAGGIPILLNLYATITVLFCVLGFYFGVGRRHGGQGHEDGAGRAARARRARRLRRPRNG